MGFFSGILGNAFGSVASSIGGSLLDKVVGGSDSGGGALGSVANIAGPLVGGILSNKSQSEANDLNYQLAQAQLQFQQEYAKNRLQWQVEDAKKAGLHPMVAAGLSPTSFSPVSAGQSGLNYDWVGEIGQNLDYAATKAKTTRQQAQAFAFTKASNELTLESLKLDNDIKRMEIMSMASRLSNSGPSAPSSGKSGSVVEGQGDSPFYISPSEVKASSSIGTQAGIPPSVQWYQNPDGSVTRSMSEQAKQANEEDLINTVLWHYDNNVVPLSLRYGGQSDFGINPADYAPPLRLLPKGAKGWLPSGYNKFVPVYEWNVPGAFYGE